MRGGDVSVVIATYNGAAHIEEQMRSVLLQSLPPNEILVCDDGSTDDTVAIVKSMANVSEIPIRIVQNEPTLGFSDNFMHGASVSLGRYIAFCDQDDIWHTNKLERTLQAMRRQRAHLATHRVDLMNSHGAIVGTDTQGIGHSRVVQALTENPWRNFFGFSLTIDRCLLEVLPSSMRGIDTHTPGLPLSHDRWLCFLGLTLGTSVYIAEPLARYRQHENQLYGSRREAKLRGVQLRRRWKETQAGVVRLAKNQSVYASIAAHRESLLWRAEWPDATALRRATRRWHRLSTIYALRTEIYRGTCVGRLCRLARLAMTGAYFSRRRFGLGPRALTQDIISLLVSDRVHERQ